MLNPHLSNPQIPFVPPVVNPEPDAPATPPGPDISPDLPDAPLPNDNSDFPARPEPDPEMPDNRETDA
jgi:hypothetical protein